MKKSTIIIIFIIYLASIVLIGFFGMKVKVYDVQKYVQYIEMNVQAEKEEMFKLEYLGKDPTTHNNKYKLIIYFREAITVGDTTCVPLNLIPKVVYDKGELDAKGESINYSTNPEAEELKELNYFSLDELGRLIVYERRISFDIFVNPNSISKIGSGAIINVFVS